MGTFLEWFEERRDELNEAKSKVRSELTAMTEECPRFTPHSLRRNVPDSRGNVPDSLPDDYVKEKNGDIPRIGSNTRVATGIKLSAGRFESQRLPRNVPVRVSPFTQLEECPRSLR